MPPLARSPWTTLTEAQLLAQCDVDTYRASGPGGQKRNKTSSAVRLRHEPSGIIVIAEESRSQHENKAKALKRLQQTFFLTIRETPPIDGDMRECPELTAITAAGKFDVGRRDSRFWPAVGVVLDVLEASACRVSDAARLLGISTGNLIDFLQIDPKVWQQANNMRAKHGQKPLK